MSIINYQLLKEQRSILREVDAPVAPDMTAIRLQISIFVMLGVEVGAQVVVVLEEEVSLADTNPEQFGVLAEKIIDLLVAVLVNCLQTAVLLLVNSS